MNNILPHKFYGKDIVLPVFIWIDPPPPIFHRRFRENLGEIGCPPPPCKSMLSFGYLGQHQGGPWLVVNYGCGTVQKVDNSCCHLKKDTVICIPFFGGPFNWFPRQSDQSGHFSSQVFSLLENGWRVGWFLHEN